MGGPSFAPFAKGGRHVDCASLDEGVLAPRSCFPTYTFPDWMSTDSDSHPCQEGKGGATSVFAAEKVVRPPAVCWREPSHVEVPR